MKYQGFIEYYQEKKKKLINEMNSGPTACGAAEYLEHINKQLKHLNKYE